MNAAWSLRRILRWTLGIGLAIVGLVTTVGGAFFMFGGSHDFAPLVAGRLTSSLARKVTIGSLHVTPGRWLRVELRDFHVANLPNGTQSAKALRR